jgi:acylphosphatase
VIAARAASAGDPGPSAVVRVTVFVRGVVHGVGFRWWTRARALELGLSGHARNTADGRVEIVAEGPVDAVRSLLALLADDPSGSSRPGRVLAMSEPWWTEARGVAGFVER